MLSWFKILKVFLSAFLSADSKQITFLKTNILCWAMPILRGDYVFHGKIDAE